MDEAERSANFGHDCILQCENLLQLHIVLENNCISSVTRPGFTRIFNVPSLQIKSNTGKCGEGYIAECMAWSSRSALYEG